MKYKFVFLFFLVSFLLFTSCQEKATLTSDDIVKNSIHFHDPEGNWSSFKGKFYFESIFSFNDSIPEKLEVSIDVKENGFQYHNLDRQVNISFPDDSCIVHSKLGNCDGYRWTKNFYTYVWGLPMKLHDPNTSISPQYQLDTIKTKPCYVINVFYTAENFKFYIDQKSFQLRAFSFFKNDNSNHGEFIELEHIKEHHEIKFPKKKVWRDLISRELIGTNEVLNIQ